MIVVFDGDCALCSRWVRWSADRLHLPSEVCWVPSQSETGQHLVRTHGVSSTPDTLVVLFPDRVLIRSSAVIAILLEMRNPFPAVSRWFSWIPVPIRDAGYRMVAAVRRRFGPSDNQCAVTPSQYLRMELPDPSNIDWKRL